MNDLNNEIKNENTGNWKNVLIVILVIVVVGLVSYISFNAGRELAKTNDKTYENDNKNDDSTKEEDNTNLDDENNEEENTKEEQLPDNSLSVLIKKHNTIINDKPTLTDSSNNTNDKSGLYSSIETNSGTTYYFRGNVTNNNVKFAGLNWKIIRINEDGTIRLIFDYSGDEKRYQFNNADVQSYDKMYYSNGSNVKTQVDNWYQTNIIDKGYDSYVATGTFCEQAKVKYASNYTSGNAMMEIYTAYKPSFKCETDGNGYGQLKLKAGLLTYDELIYAGGYVDKSNSNFYLYNGKNLYWTMSPAGFNSKNGLEWYVPYDKVSLRFVVASCSLRPVINLNASVLATGTGTSADPYVIQTN